MEKYNKIDENTLEVIKIIESKEIVSLSQLEYDKNSLIKTKDNNLIDVEGKNAEIDKMIFDIDIKINKFKELVIDSKSIDIPV